MAVQGLALAVQEARVLEARVLEARVQVVMVQGLEARVQVVRVVQGLGLAVQGLAVLAAVVLGLVGVQEPEMDHPQLACMGRQWQNSKDGAHLQHALLLHAE
jgi:hypothetical protein